MTSQSTWPALRAALQAAGVDGLIGEVLNAFASDPVLRDHPEVLALTIERVGGIRLGSAADSWGDPDREAAEAISAARRPLALVGPGVLRDQQVASLRTFAAAANLPVLNTWGAKGVFHWRSRHHVATIGLQRDDFTLGGFNDADLIVTSGLDPLESAGAPWSDGRAVVDIEPSRLAATSELLACGNAELPVATIRQRLAGATAAGWESPAIPIAPSLLTKIYGEVVGPGGLVVADPGRAGFFVARTCGTTRPGGVVVPSGDATDGFAVAALIVNHLLTPWRPAIAAVDDASHPAVVAGLKLARRWGVPVTLDVWGPGGELLDADGHLRRLRDAAVSPDQIVTSITLDGAQLDRFVEAAGPVVVWAGRLSLL